MTATTTKPSGRKQSQSQGIPYHELCEKFFDPIEGPDFEQLVADVKQNGLQDKIVLHDRAIIDGRNRYRALLELGEVSSGTAYADLIDDKGRVKPEYSRFFAILPRPGSDDPVSYVISKNLRRRHLDATARAQAADKIADYRLGQNQHTEGSANLQTLEKAAGEMNVSPRQAHSARTVRVKGTSELKAAVEARDEKGKRKLSLADAEAASNLPPADQAEIAKVAMEGNKKAAVRKIRSASK